MHISCMKPGTASFPALMTVGSTAALLIILIYGMVNAF
jgi:hypothetical protein